MEHIRSAVKCRIGDVGGGALELMPAAFPESASCYEGHVIPSAGRICPLPTRYQEFSD